MSEQAKVRLVRCPKCENLLPELNDYSVYQCGGCGAVLKAKRTTGELDAFSEKSEEERNGGGSEGFSQKSEDIDVYEQRIRNPSDASEDDVKSKNSSFTRERRRFFNDGVENYGASSMSRAGKRIVQDSDGIDKNANGISYSRMEIEIDNGMGLQRSPEVPDWRIRERDIEGFQRVQRIDEVGMRYSTQKYSEEGRLNYHSHDRYTYGEPFPERNEMMGYGEVAYPREDHAELLQKLDKLRDKLSRSCDLADRTKDKIPLHRRMLPQQDPYGYSDKWFSEGYLTAHKASAPVSFPDNRAERPSYINDHYSEPSASVDRHAMFGYGIYPSSHTSGPSSEFYDHFRPQMLRRQPYQASASYQQKPSPAHFSGPYRDGNIFRLDSFESHPPALNHHHPSCSCFQCYGRYQAPPQRPPNVHADRRFPDGSKELPFFPHEYPNEYAGWDYSLKISDPPSVQSHGSQSHSGWPTDVNSEASDLVHSHPSQVLVANSGHQCQPVAGGAPFLACQNCNELLQLPKKTFINNTKQKKIRCGACSALIILVVDNKRLDISVHVEANMTCVKEHAPHKKNLSEGSSYAQVHPNHASVNFSSEDYDNSGYDFQSMYRDLGSVSNGRRSSSKSGDIRNSHSAYSSSSDVEDNLESSRAATEDSNSVAAREVSDSADGAKEKPSPPPVGSPLQDYFDYSNKFHFMNRHGDGNRSGHSEQEKAKPNKTSLRESSIKDASATEIEISSNEYSNTGTSLDSDEVRRGVQVRTNKTDESFFAGIMKKSFRDLSKSNSTVEQEKPNITVNGNLIPDRLIKKAEKLTGRIHPGHYWYDFRAGFWGVLGGPCLGIVPPFIEEFNYPMPENCSCGKTGVFVNSRELHQKDLNLLSSRGLPIERDRSYIVEISGRVLDEGTGEELESLGKLAPTIERLKRGFGMKDPKATA